MKSQETYRNEQRRLFELENLLILSEALFDTTSAKEMNRVLNEIKKQINSINKISHEIIRE